MKFRDEDGKWHEVKPKPEDKKAADAAQPSDKK
jgi:hypothetical protein